MLLPVRRALHQLRLRLLPVRDPWERLPYEAPLSAFGDGARNGFDWVFAGETRVRVASFDEVRAWLAECHYVTDVALFNESDYWQHPATFEQIRRGDCEDFALWAWRRMVELRIDADFVVGRRVPPGTDNSRHAWIMYRHGGDEFVYEPVCGDAASAVRTLADARASYIPEFGVDATRRRFLFAGYAYVLQNPRLRLAQASR